MILTLNVMKFSRTERAVNVLSNIFFIIFYAAALTVFYELFEGEKR